jgi:hypothetical protein
MPKPEDEWRYGFTRSPWDRVVSLWCLAHPTDSERERSPFRAWVLGGMGSPYRHGPKFAHLSLPTLRWLEGADFVGRFETREEDLARLATLLGREVPVLPDAEGRMVPAHIAKARDRAPYPDYYDEVTRAWVAERYREDVEAFGYSFEGVPCTI